MEKKFTPVSMMSLWLMIIGILPTFTWAQNCNCNVNISKTTGKYNARNVLPGQVICLDTGTRTVPLIFYNLTGAPGNPIVIKNNCNGRTVFNLSPGYSYGIKFDSSSKYFHITGTGSSAEYGIVVNGAHQSVQIGGFSTDFEVDHIYVSNSGFAAFMAKTDSSGRGNFVMKNVSFHHNYVAKTNSGEGFYIGNTSWSQTGPQHDIDSIEVYDNITDSTGAEGIQVGCTYSGHAWVHDNQVMHAGADTTPFGNYQSNGIQLGQGFSGKCYNNLILAPKGNGMAVLGVGDIMVYNNVIIKPGEIGLYTGTGHNTNENGRKYHFLQNTFIMDTNANPAIRYAPSWPDTGFVYNNIVVKRDTLTKNVFDRTSGIMVLQGNVVRATSADLHFADTAHNNYDILAGSAAIDAGINIAAYGITTDYLHRLRPAGNYDAGAYEYQGSSLTTVYYRVNAGGLEIADTTVNWSKDKQTDPCPWLDLSGNNYTTGSDQPWSGTNNTDAPKQIFSTNRYASTIGNQQVNYNFPVNNGTYEVRLYFAENTYQAAGQRVFDVRIEDSLRLDHFDIYAAAGYRNGYKRTFNVTVTDGVLDIDFIRDTGNPQINGIAIVAPTGNARTGFITAGMPSTTPHSSLQAFPVPLQNTLVIRKKGLPEETAETMEISLLDIAGRIIYKGKQSFANDATVQLDLSPYRLSPGVYLLKLSGAKTQQVIRLVK